MRYHARRHVKSHPMSGVANYQGPEILTSAHKLKVNLRCTSSQKLQHVLASFHSRLL